MIIAPDKSPSKMQLSEESKVGNLFDTYEIIN